MPQTVQLDAPDDEIRAMVVEWSERIANKQFADALAMFPNVDTSLGPDDLRRWIENYGSYDAWPDGRKYKLTTLKSNADWEECAKMSIEIDRDNLYGLDATEYIGMVHYDDVPLNGEPSDLTARFNIKRVDSSRITLEFVDINVM